MQRLEEPIYFYALALLPFLLVVLLYKFWWQKRTQKVFAKHELLQKLAPDYSVYKATIKYVFLALAIAFLVIALVNPKIGTKLETVKREGVDIVFALDVSKSMLSEDIAPNRLEKAKQIILKTIDQLGSDRIGIIIYAGNSYPLLPITTDHAAAKLFLKNASPDMVSSQGTAINEALNSAKNYYNNEEQTNKYLVILSDGEDHEENTIDKAKELAEEGIKVITIGIGTEKGGVIPDMINGYNKGLKKDKNGEVVITQRHAQVLKEVAENTKGFYVDGNKTATSVNKIIEVLSKAKKTEFETKQFSDYKSQFQWFIGLGILWLILDLFVFEKKTKWVKSVNLFNENEK
ncbi:VWA domain-containing protein [Wenyingzhuangia sp. 2_MG-2023]|uniref:VWA domain-containing protein n=1 Tax=Wenyingzhuangia sp. 2_MG-2023 TaxID=3062639 RepID=UPI0026E3479D|nr:VWA domain-containing protein [Wenyingzhuangia sp. 2_MG-2023]MDO6736662.1 VWA domain-containing protein [Wenyingzhuangia sp. 2_MG-2023]MDO6801043.1 VWA domain-containing protein [Wenyingzhuangia sp. 1_MG-2023]